jgi:hypothetical protein
MTIRSTRCAALPYKSIRTASASLRPGSSAELEGRGVDVKDGHWVSREAQSDV